MGLVWEKSGLGGYGYTRIIKYRVLEISGSGIEKSRVHPDQSLIHTRFWSIFIPKNPVLKNIPESETLTETRNRAFVISWWKLMETI